MNTLIAKKPKTRIPSRAAKNVRFAGGMLCIELTDGRNIGVPLSRFPWLDRTTVAQRKKWPIEPHGFAVYWDSLDDGIEIEHLFE